MRCSTTGSLAVENPAVRRDLVKFATGASPQQRLLELSEQMRTFTRPVLILWAARRSDDAAGACRPIGAAVCPNATKVIVEDSWTLIPEDQPAAMAVALRNFVR